MIDALGWKGIWNTHNFRHIVTRLQRLVTFAEGRCRKFVHERVRRSSSYGNSGVKVLFLSDTVVFVINTDRRYLEEDPSSAQYMLQALLTETLAGFLAEAATPRTSEDPCLVYRGALAPGEYCVDDRFIIGPAIDEAAANMEVADGALVWFPRYPTVAQPELLAALPYSVPLKDGRHIQAMVVNPFYGMTRGEAEPLRDRILRSFERGKRPPLELLVKQQNTRAFLDEALKTCASI